MVLWVYCGFLLMTLTRPPGSSAPYSIEAGPLSTSTRSVVALKLCPRFERTPSRRIEPSSLVPNPRLTSESREPPRVLPWLTPLTNFIASLSERT
ncbi:hypothetical protein D3C80_1864520 [compost metagenome]